MIPLLAIVLTVYLVIGCIRVVARFWDLFAETHVHPREQRLIVWFAKGVLIPVVVWVLFNFTLAPGHVATMDHVMVKKLSPAGWTSVLGWLSLPAALVAATFWAAATLGWLVTHLVAHTESRREIFGAGISGACCCCRWRERSFTFSAGGGRWGRR